MTNCNKRGPPDNYPKLSKRFKSADGSIVTSTMKRNSKLRALVEEEQRRIRELYRSTAKSPEMSDPIRPCEPTLDEMPLSRCTVDLNNKMLGCNSSSSVAFH
ncbi:uncharacterized protein LOC123262507 isoform X2 [Cotesia glomerata]|uniref:uncharacterized protein LOC123262507 isoform X2 n=1 Tax=Cotesia glomerata TaxID=32391 RepID=UPI001D02D96C|nr:uncharacterized protein LOC123262507 isoform X2 [Cotesia glomerata]